ncbi:MAG: VOC family protein, partial [Oscillospiraceae bacterium]
MITGLLHSAISVRDMKASLKFYCELLGAKILFTKDDPEGNPLIVCLQFSDGSCLELFYPREEYPVGRELGRNHFCLIADDIYEVEGALDAAGVTIESRVQKVRDNNLQVWC